MGTLGMFGLIAGAAMQALMGGPTENNYKADFQHGLLPVGPKGAGGAAETKLGYGCKDAAFGAPASKMAQHDPWSATYKTAAQKTCALNMYHCFDLQEGGVPHYAKTYLMGPNGGR